MDAAANRFLDSARSLDLHLILHCPTVSPESTLSLHWVYTLLIRSPPCPPLPSTAHRIAKPLLLLSHGGSKTTTSKPLSGQSSKMRWPEKTSSCAARHSSTSSTSSRFFWICVRLFWELENECFPQFRLPPNHGRHSSRTPVFQKLFDERMSHAFMPVTRPGWSDVQALCNETNLECEQWLRRDYV